MYIKLALFWIPLIFITHLLTKGLMVGDSRLFATEDPRLSIHKVSHAYRLSVPLYYDHALYLETA
jgi:hypothetical protein